MIATAQPISPSPPLSPSRPPRRPGRHRDNRWSPDGDAHLIYEWVKMQGKTQLEVASMLNISQSTVSRIVQRYERWQAHAKEREGGRLDHAERLRAQRWLTFERNELILSSCLRIAHDLEGSIDTSKSTTLHHASQPSKEIEVRTHHACIDRTGMVARFLRLAFRINMEQLKLSQLDPLPPAPPLTPQELDDDDLQATADAAELATALGRVGSAHHAAPDAEGGSGANAVALVARSEPRPIDVVPPPDELGSPSEARREPAAPAASPLSPRRELGDVDHRNDISESRVAATPALATSDPSASTLNFEPGTLNSTAHSPTHHSPAPLHNLHTVHTETTAQIAATTTEPCTCTPQPPPEKNLKPPCITDRDQASWYADTRPHRATRDPAATAARS